MQKESKSVKETTEFIAGVAEVAVTVKKIRADGKVDASDLKHVLDLAKKHDILTAAVKDANDIPAELKDLTAEELQEIGAAAVVAFTKYRMA